MDEDDRLGEDCIKLLSAAEAEGPYRNYMKNAKGEEPLEIWVGWSRLFGAMVLTMVTNLFINGISHLGILWIITNHGY